MGTCCHTRPHPTHHCLCDKIQVNWWHQVTDLCAAAKIFWGLKAFLDYMLKLWVIVMPLRGVKQVTSSDKSVCCHRDKSFLGLYVKALGHFHAFERSKTGDIKWRIEPPMKVKYFLWGKIFVVGQHWILCWIIVVLMWETWSKIGLYQWQHWGSNYIRLQIAPFMWQVYGGIKWHEFTRDDLNNNNT